MFLSFDRKGSPRERGTGVCLRALIGWMGWPGGQVDRVNSVGTRGDVEGDPNDSGRRGQVDLRFRIRLGRLGERGEAA